MLAKFTRSMSRQVNSLHKQKTTYYRKPIEGALSSVELEAAVEASSVEHQVQLTRFEPRGLSESTEMTKMRQIQSTYEKETMRRHATGCY